MKKWLQGLFGTSTSANRKKQNKDLSSNENFQLIEREQIKGTPFWIQKVEPHGWFISLKGYKLTEPTKTKEEAIQKIWLENDGWNVIANMIIIIHEQVANEAAKLLEERQKHPHAPNMQKDIILQHTLEEEQERLRRKNRNLGEM